MARTERRAGNRRGTALTASRRALDADLPYRSVDVVDVLDPASRADRPHRMVRAVPPPIV